MVAVAKGGKVFDRLALFLFVLLAILRVAYAVQAVQNTPVLRQPLADSIAYVESARAIASGSILSDEPFYRAPLYQYVIAPFYALARNPEKSIVAFQVVLGIGILSLTWRIARTLYGPAPALLALLLVGLYGALAATETKLLGTTLSIFIATLALRILIGPGGRRRFFAAGLVLGLAALARPAIVLIVLGMVPIMILSRAERREALRSRMIPLLLGLVLSIAPATVHNLLAGDYVLISSNGGMTFYHGNNRFNRSGLPDPGPLSDPTGNAVRQAARDRERASELVGGTLRPSQSSAFWFRQGIKDLTADPAAAARLWGQKLLRFVAAHEYGDNYSYWAEQRQVWLLRLFAVPFTLLLILATAAALLNPPRRREDFWVLFFAGLGFVTCMLFSVGSRYRCESVPALAILAGSILIAWPAAARRRQLFAGGVSILLAALACLPPHRSVAGQDSMARAHWAGALERDGRPDEARTVYASAARRDPGNEIAWARWASLEAETKGIVEAVSILDSAIVSGGDGSLTRAQRGSSRVLIGDYAGAEEDLRFASRIDPGNPTVTLNLAACLVRRGMNAEAASLLHLAGLDDDPIARYYRGLLEMRASNWLQAIREFDEAITLGSSDPRPAFLRAMAWIRSGSSEKAADWFQGWLAAEQITLSAAQIEEVLVYLGSEPSEAWLNTDVPADPDGERLVSALRSVWRAWSPVQVP